MNQTLISRLYLNGEGLAIFLGGISQARVFIIVLEEPGNDLRHILRVYNALYEPIAYTTLATIANKLCDKGILKRTKTVATKTQYTYVSNFTEDELIATCVDAVVNKLCEEYPEYISRSCFTLVNQESLHTRDTTDV